MQRSRCSFGPRITGTLAHREMGDWLVQELNQNGWNVLIQPFRPLDEVEARNIIAFRGSGPVIILGAHYDTRMIADSDPNPDNRNKPVPGANDGASGVAVLLELARTLDVQSTNHTICLAFFDAEDNGRIPGWNWILGSRYFVDNLDGLEQCQSPRHTIIVDMIGDADQQILWEPNSDSALTEAIWSVAKQLGFGEWFVLAPGTALIDDHTPFIEAGFTAIDIIDFTYPYWHTVEDTMDKLGAGEPPPCGHYAGSMAGEWRARPVEEIISMNSQERATADDSSLRINEYLLYYCIGQDGTFLTSQIAGTA